MMSTNLVLAEQLISGGIVTNEEFINSLNNFPIVTDNKQNSFFNIPSSFDIETSSFYSGQQEKIGIMYEWTFGINGVVTIGRTWYKFVELYLKIVQKLELEYNKRLIVYVHNLAYEFQFIRRLFSWDKVFCMDERKPLYAITEEGIEFRCSYRLSGKSLAKLGADLQVYKMKKMSGDLDYSLIRNSETPLSEKELKYCENDVRVIMCYIQECIDSVKYIYKLPLTKTGYVRQYCKKACYSGSRQKWFNYRNIMKSLTLDAEEYQQLKRAFCGGFTHANALYSGKVLFDVASFDFGSSYPAVMLSRQFPMSKAERYIPESKDDFKKQLRAYCCLFDIEFFNIQSKTIIEHPLSFSRCKQVINHVVDNGRIVSANHVKTTITEQDYMVLEQFYTWEDANVTNFKRYMKAYLPKDFAMAVLNLYIDKTQLKDIEGKEVEYMLSKERLNSCYGMCVTDIVRENVSYSDDGYEMFVPDLEEAINKYNNGKNRFLFYPWGVWITAYARSNLFTGILACGEDYVYSDTDSVKILNIDKHRGYFEDYNKSIREDLKRAAEHWGINPEQFSPMNKDGKKKYLGAWEYEKTYKRFKTLGAKRYMVEFPNALKGDNGRKYNIAITVSGVNKFKATPYLCDTYSDPFEVFDEGLLIPAEHTGKQTLTYIDYETRGTVKDYLGNVAEYHEMSSIHMEGCEYNLSMTAAYLDYILGVREKLM